MAKEGNMLVDYLKTIEPEKVLEESKNLAVSSFRYAAENVPAYKKFLSGKKINPKEVNSFEDFKKKVPIIKKEDIFPKFNISELCVGGNIDGMSYSFTSSGFSGIFAYGIVTEDMVKNEKGMIDSLIDLLFNVGKEKILLVNSMPMGVSFSSSHPVLKTSVRSDMVIAFVKAFHDKFEHIIIISDPHFAKKILEEGIELGLNWKSIKVSFVLGEDWFSNSLVNYLKSFLSKESQIRNTMGMTEFGLNLFNDSQNLAKIRDIAQKDEKLRYALFGKSTEACPELMHHYINRTFLEIVNQDKKGFGEMVFSNLDKSAKMPLMRYNSQDIGKLFSYDEIKEILIKNGYNKLVPELKLPIAAISGRSGKFVSFNKKKITPEEIKEAIYRDFSVANSITGYFRLGKKLEIQLKKKIKPDKSIEKKLQKRIFQLVNINIPIKLYEHEKLPYGMCLDYESKFRCI